MIKPIQLFISVITLLCVITLFACKGKKKEVHQLNLKDDAPIAEGTNINLKYTDSGKVVTNLISPKLLDFSNFKFSYQEFTQGITLHFWNEKNEKTTITSDYAIRYDLKNLVDLQEIL